MSIQLFTIGLTQKNAETFFTILREAKIRRVLDIRLSNDNHITGYARMTHLQFFLRELCGADYHHFPQCAPTAEILDAYKNGGMAWDEYVRQFLPLIRSRHIETLLTPELLDYGCLLCSEPTPDKCHRRLVAEYMQKHVTGMKVTHL